MIHREDRDGVAVLTIEHGKVNAVDLDLFDDLGRAVGEAVAAGARALVLTGHGSSFSAGVDLDKAATGGIDYLAAFLPKLSDEVTALFEMPLPVVAAVNGHAIAGGLILALACDRRIAAEDRGRLGLTELLVGVPFPVAPLEIARFTVPEHHLQDLVLTGRLVSPDEALAMGLVDEVVPFAEVLDQAVAEARRLAAIPAESFAITKRQLRAATARRIEGLRPASDPEVLAAWSRPEILDGMRRFLAKARSS